MRVIIKSIMILVLIFINLLAFETQAQLGFCSGNSGEPIFNESFGTGIINGPPLAAGTTTYTYVDTEPFDGNYTISSNTAYFDWHDTTDHTPNDTDGKALIVNADFTAGEFYRRPVSGLCENTSYEFSAWIVNLLPNTTQCPNGGIPINVKFQIWDATDSNLLATGDTGTIGSTEFPVWLQYGLVFQTLSGQTSVILKMINNGNGGCGNDLAIDDIIFKTCGDFISITDAQNNTGITICEEDAPVTVQLTANPDFSIYSTHAYQWQQSNDGTNWIDIAEETNQIYNPPLITNSIFYRVKVAEDATNLTNPLCISISETFDIQIIEKPATPISNGDVINCGDQNLAASVTVPNNVVVNWYDSPTGGNLILANNAVYQTNIAGTYYAEAISSIVDCISDARTAVSISFFDALEVENQTLTFCQGQQIMLDAGIDNVTYLWNTGEITSQITVNEGGEYTVEVTNTDGCSNTITITLTQIDTPIIDNISSDGSSIIISTLNSGPFEYSLDDNIYQTSNVFSNMESGVYTIYIRVNDGCESIALEFIHFVIPKFFTPNGDNFHDTFDLKGIENYNTFEVQIFDRFGKLLMSTQNIPIAWDGTYNSRPLPSSDYWYIIKVDDTIFSGHLTLKR